MARRNTSTYQLAANADMSHPDTVHQLNRLLQQFGDRLDTLQQTGVTPPTAPLGVTATGKQGAIWITWNRIQGVDGYTLLVAQDSGMKQILHRFPIPDADSCSYPMVTGNSATTYWFTVTAYKGNVSGNPSAAVSATSVAYTTTGTAPPNPPQAPRNSTIVPRNGTTLT